VEWTEIKRRWSLSIDVQEKAALAAIAEQCPGTGL
jgi:hypothetical protein